MQDFIWTEFTESVVIHAPVQAVYDAWSNAAAIERWFLSDATNTDSEGKPLDAHEAVRPGCLYTWHWYLYDGEEKNAWQAANGKDHLRFLFAGACPVDIRLEAWEDQTILRLTQSDIPTDDNSKRSIRLGCQKGWAFFLVNLKSVLEGGVDLRNKDERLQPMLNN